MNDPNFQSGPADYKPYAIANRVAGRALAMLAAAAIFGVLWLIASAIGVFGR